MLNEQDGVHATFVDTMLKDIQLPRYEARRTRRTYSAQFKADLVVACQRPAASIAALTLQHGMNANVLHRWLKEYDHGRHRLDNADAATAADKVVKPTFVPIALTALEPDGPSQPTASTTAASNIRMAEVCDQGRSPACRSAQPAR